MVTQTNYNRFLTYLYMIDNNIFIKIISSVVVLFSIFLIGCSQALISTDQDLNFDFEQYEEGFPRKWGQFGADSYKIKVDSLQSKNGRFSVVIENTSDSTGFKALSLTLPKNYKGKSIRLSGYIKTENVRDGFAGLWMRIDPKVGFDNMNDRGVTGTTDWKEYEVILPLSPEKTEKILVGGLLIGKGKMWLDDIKVTIDGKSLDDQSLEILGSTADRDMEFNKGSNIVISKLNNQDIENLELLGRVWGFVKYYHPNIAKGEYNWDYELFRFLPDFLKVNNSSERDEALAKWIKKFGNLPACTSCQETAKDAVIKPDLIWIDSLNISKDLKNILYDLYNNRNQGEHYYISFQKGVGNPIFRNEKSYLDMPYPDDGFRLLSIFKYWNIIQYFFPYKHLANNDWNIVLKKYIPVFLNAKNELEYEIAALQVIGEVNDTHANLWGGGDKLQYSRGQYAAPFKTDFIEHQLVVTDFYKSDFPEITKIKIGDVITHINGKSIETLVDSLQPYYPHSNEASMRRDISRDLLRSSDKTLGINYSGSKQNKQTKILLYDYKDLNIQALYQEKKKQPAFKLLTDSIGYLTLESIEFSDLDKLKDTLKELNGLEIDIRNYPNKFVALKLPSLLVSHQTEFVKFSILNINNPGEFNFRRGTLIEPERYNNQYKYRKPFTGKIVVLVNEISQSQSEYTAMALRAVPGSLIIGNTTAGADGNVSYINLPGGLSTMISGIGVYYPDGRETQRIGIVPDIIVNPTINGIKSGKDEVLEKAIEILRH